MLSASGPWPEILEAIFAVILTVILRCSLSNSVVSLLQFEHKTILQLLCAQKHIDISLKAKCNIH